jgi:hypothetical protein
MIDELKSIRAEIQAGNHLLELILNALTYGVKTYQE